MVKKKNGFQEVTKNIWPNTKKELEKMMKNAKKMLDKGETHLKDFSEKSVNQTKKISLGLQKEKIYYDLGKVAARTPTGKWKITKKINKLLSEIKKLDKEIKKLK